MEDLFLSMDGIDKNKYVIATYYIESEEADLLKQTAEIVVEQTTGTWVPVPEETPEVREKHAGKVLAVYEVPDYELPLRPSASLREMELPPNLERRKYIAQIAFPVINIGEQIPMLLTTVIGNISMMGRLKLIDLAFGEKFVSAFSGPKFGIDGIRELLKIEKRPILCNMIKPCTGIPPKVGAKLFYEAAVGGVDIVKDDELIADAPFSHIEERVKEFMAAEKRAYEEKGERTLYAVNITDRVDKIKENAQKAISAGANCLMLNYLTAGISALRILAEEKSIQVPILAHLDFAGTMYESHNSGISSHLVLGKFPRLAGADIVVYPCPYAKFLLLREKHIKIAFALRTPLYHLKPTFPMPGGGVHPGMLPTLMQDIGTDWIVGAGGAVHGHPMGATAGAKALRQAIDAMMAGIPLEEAIKEHKELKASIDAWGIHEKAEKNAG